MLMHIKDSRTLCPVTLKEVQAKILEDEGCVFLRKEPWCGNEYLLEKNADFYKGMDIAYKKQRRVFNKVMIDITAKCNLKCPVCYRRDQVSADVDVNTLRRLSQEWRGKIVSLCGGEPTVREDLPEIIGMFSKRNTVFLITNGIRLADFAYLKDLKRAGLRYLSLSLNALSEDVLSKINGEGILSRKLQALDNLEKAKIRVILAMVLVRGINEKELKGLFELCLVNRHFIRELRIRTMAPFGAYLNCEKFCLSEMISVIAREFNISTEDLLKEFQLKKMTNELSAKEIFTIKSCSFDFHLRIKNRIVVSVAKGLNLKEPGHPVFFLNKISILIILNKIYGIDMVWRGCLKLLFKKQSLPWVHSKHILKIGLRVWPDINTIDMEENRRCETGYWMDGKIFSFCHANIIKKNMIMQSK